MLEGRTPRTHFTHARERAHTRTRTLPGSTIAPLHRPSTITTSTGRGLRDRRRRKSTLRVTWIPNPITIFAYSTRPQKPGDKAQKPETGHLRHYKAASITPRTPIATGSGRSEAPGTWQRPICSLQQSYRFFDFTGDRSGRSRAKPITAGCLITKVSSLGQLPAQDRATSSHAGEVDPDPP